jgi:hypothetical protein
MNKNYQLILALVLTGLTSHAVAVTPGYSFISVEYYKFSSRIDGISEVPEGNGISYDFSVAVRPNIAITGGYRTGSANVTTSGTIVDADIESISLGILVHLPINETADFILATGFINGNADVDKNGAFFANVDADGGATSLGVRAMVSDKLELNGFVHKNSIEDTSRIGISLGAAYYFTESVSVDLDYFIDSDNDSFAFGLTKYF